MINNPRSEESYILHTCDESEFRSELSIQDDEGNSEWFTDIPTKEIRLEAVVGLEMYKSTLQHLDPDILLETAGKDGSQLLLSFPGAMEMVAVSAIDSINRVAGIQGPALTKMISPTCAEEKKAPLYVEVINDCLTVAKGDSNFCTLLKRYGRIYAAHGRSYCIMPVHELYDTALEGITTRFGNPKFEEGTVTHTQTACLWTLPEAQNQMIQKYQESLAEAGAISNYAISFMPAIVFKSSDTSDNAATVVPSFVMDGNRILSYTDGIRVRHIKSQNTCGIEAFKEELATIFAKFDETFETIKKLAGITIYNPVNCVIRLARKFKIAEIYGDAARNDIEMLTGGSACSAHDVYLAMTACVAEAKNRSASQNVINTIDNSVSLIGKLTDWSVYDIGGSVSW